MTTPSDPKLGHGDVLTRLDSLLQQAGPNCDDPNVSGPILPTTKSSGESSISKSSISQVKGILRKPNGQAKKSAPKSGRRIRFPEKGEDMNEVIGYGGVEELYSEDEDDSHTTGHGSLSKLSSSSNKKAGLSEAEELTLEEKNFLNLTKKNTNFNSRAENLCDEGTAVRLGAEKKSNPPLITVRPFVQEHTPGRVNKVSPMINGQVVKTTKFSSPEPKTTTEPSPSVVPTQIVEEKRVAEKDKTNDEGLQVDSRKSEKVGCSPSPSPSSGNDTTTNTAARKDSSEVEAKQIGGEVREGGGGGGGGGGACDAQHHHNPEEPLDKNLQVSRVGKASLAAARLSFLHATILDKEEGEKEHKKKSRTNQQITPPVIPTGQGKEQMTLDLSAPPEDAKIPEQPSLPDAEPIIVHDLAPPAAPATPPSEHHSQPSCPSSLSVNEQQEVSPASGKAIKLTRRSPSVSTPRAASILKGTPRPTIIKKEKPKIPEKPKTLIKKISAPPPIKSQAPLPPVVTRDSPPISTAQLDDQAKKASPIAAPRTASFRKSKEPPSEYANIKAHIERKHSMCEANNSITEVIVEDDTKIEVPLNLARVVDSERSTGITNRNVSLSAAAEFYTTEADAQNEVIFEDESVVVAADNNTDREPQSDVSHGQCAEKIKIPASRFDDFDEHASEANGPTSFAEKRAALAKTLEFNRVESHIHRPSTKRQAPQPPPSAPPTSSTMTKTTPVLDNPSAKSHVIDSVETTSETPSHSPQQSNENMPKDTSIHRETTPSNNYSHDETKQLSSSSSSSFFSNSVAEEPQQRNEEDVRGSSSNFNSSSVVSTSSSPSNIANPPESMMVNNNDSSSKPVKSALRAPNQSLDRNRVVQFSPDTMDAPTTPTHHDIHSNRAPIGPSRVSAIPYARWMGAGLGGRSNSSVNHTSSSFMPGGAPHHLMLHKPPAMLSPHHSRLAKQSSVVIESSFTGQPIQMMTRSSLKRSPHNVPLTSQQQQKQQQQQQQQQQHLHQQQHNHQQHQQQQPSTPQQPHYPPPVMMLTSGPGRDDEVRRWTEKKKRSKSVPRGSEIDELMGSSKTKPKTRLFMVGSSSPPTIRRQSRVELYEADRRMQKKNKFSFTKLLKQFKNVNQIEESPAQQFMDEEHGREIIEREMSKLKPTIIHPIDFQNGSPVEVVPIRPNPGHVFEKHKSAGVRKGASPVKSSMGAVKAKVEYTDSKDSGHETSSNHTDNSDPDSSSEFQHSRTPSSVDESEEPTSPSSPGEEDDSVVVNGRRNSSSSSLNGKNNLVGNPTSPEAHLSTSTLEKALLNAAQLNAFSLYVHTYSRGRPKPLPPPRIHSLEPSSASGGVSSPSSSTSSQDYATPQITRNDAPPGNESCSNHYASSPVFVTSMAPVQQPPIGYVQAGKMSLGGSLNVPALNSSNL
eukprot:TCALIF_03031-PA protein Name:"Protein of unknown function" AED:0.08 eAED:0.27 QI:0/0.25/0.2/0.8/0.75/0.4/5/0/1414